jgi:hypothetical protein
MREGADAHLLERLDVVVLRRHGASQDWQERLGRGAVVESRSSVTRKSRRSWLSVFSWISSFLAEREKVLASSPLQVHKSEDRFAFGHQRIRGRPGPYAPAASSRDGRGNDRDPDRPWRRIDQRPPSLRQGCT